MSAAEKNEVYEPANFSVKVNSEDFVKNMFSNYFARFAVNAYIKDPMIGYKIEKRLRSEIPAVIERNLKSGKIGQSDFDDAKAIFEDSTTRMAKDFGNPSKLIQSIRDYWFYSKSDENALYQDVKTLNEKSRAGLQIPGYINDGYEILRMGFGKRDAAVSSVLSKIGEDVTTETSIGVDTLREASRGTYVDREEFMNFQKKFGSLDMKLYIAINMVSENGVKRIRKEMLKNGNPISEDAIFKTNLDRLNRDDECLQIIGDTYADCVVSKYNSEIADDLFPA